MTRGDGDGWVDCSCGRRHWGRFGSAGVLLRRPDGLVLMQHRAEFSHEGGTWGVPGGARNSDESAVTGARRELFEEAGVPPEALAPRLALLLDHGPWSYTTVVADLVDDSIEPYPADRESIAVEWVDPAAVTERPLLRAFGRAWPQLSAALDRRCTIVVDAANVIGSSVVDLVPGGWWRDRSGAARALLRRLADAPPVPSVELPIPLAWPATVADPLPLLWFPHMVVVLEGAFRAAVEPSSRAGMAVVHAPGSGDDEIVRQADMAHGFVVVATADRELRGRVAAVGAEVVGPRHLLDLAPAVNIVA